MTLGLGPDDDLDVAVERKEALGVLKPAVITRLPKLLEAAPIAPQSVPSAKKRPGPPFACRAKLLILVGLLVPRTGIEPVTP